MNGRNMLKAFPRKREKNKMLNDYLNRYTAHIDSAKLRQIRDDQQERFYAPGLKKLHDSFDAIPELKSEKNIFDQKHVTFGEASDLSDEERAKLRATLLEMLPWRKGPYDVAGIEIDCEWRSDLKWDRVKKVLDPLKGKKICDIGANSGYHMYRMLAEDPELVIGLDPTIRYWFQFQALQKLTADNEA